MWIRDFDGDLVNLSHVTGIYTEKKRVNYSDINKEDYTLREFDSEEEAKCFLNYLWDIVNLKKL